MHVAKPGLVAAADSVSYFLSLEVFLSVDMMSMVDSTQLSFSSLIEFAANDYVDGIKGLLCDESETRKVGLWCGQQMDWERMVLELRTLLMVAAKHGSVQVLKLILALPEVDVNSSYGPERSTALHGAASGGSLTAIDSVKLLLSSGADPNATDSNGHRPVDVINSNSPDLRIALENLLRIDGSVCDGDLQASIAHFRHDDPPLLMSSEESTFSSVPDRKFHSSSAKKEYLADPSLPGIKNSIYTTDEFRMFSFKIRPCSRAYSHDWTECPFAHPGENARRRDPRKFHYSSVPCPDHRKGTCRRGELCEFAHGIFECWLHPTQYRTRLCKDGTNCTRRVCFFAHTSEELRPLHVSVRGGAALPSPRAAVAPLATALNQLPDFQRSASAMSSSPFATLVSPFTNIHSSAAWAQQNFANLHMPSNIFQSGQRRVLLNAQGTGFRDFELQQWQLPNGPSCPSHSKPYRCSSYMNHFALMRASDPSNINKASSAEASFPRYIDQPSDTAAFHPSNKSDRINKEIVFPPKSIDHSILQASYGHLSPARMPPQINKPISLVTSQLSILSHHEKLRHQLCSLSSSNVNSNHHGHKETNPRLKFESANGTADWPLQAEELLQFGNSCSVKHYTEEPDVSWVQSLLKESPIERKESTGF